MSDKSGKEIIAYFQPHGSKTLKLGSRDLGDDVGLLAKK